MRKWLFLSSPLAPLVLFSVVLTVCWSAYFAMGASPSLGFEYLASGAFCVLILFWIVADARSRNLVPCFDFGFLCYAFFPTSLVWYCLWSRGWRGLLTLLLLASLWVVPVFLAALLGGLFR